MQLDELKNLVITAIEDMKGENIVALDVTDKSNVTDMMIVATGTSNRHVSSIANNVVVEAKKAGVPPMGVEGETQGDWALVDLGDIVVHVMQPQVREFYDLERLWSVTDSKKKERNAG